MHSSSASPSQENLIASLRRAGFSDEFRELRSEKTIYQYWNLSNPYRYRAERESVSAPSDINMSKFANEINSLRRASFIVTVHDNYFDDRLDYLLRGSSESWPYWYMYDAKTKIRYPYTGWIARCFEDTPVDKTKVVVNTKYTTIKYELLKKSAYARIDIDNTIHHKAYYEQSMLKNEIDESQRSFVCGLLNIFHTHTIITSSKEQTNLKYLKLFLNDDLLTSRQKKNYLTGFSRYSWTFCTWVRLLPKTADAETLNLLHSYLFEIAEELGDEQEKQKFLNPDMIHESIVTAYKEKNKNIFYKTIDLIRIRLQSLATELSEHLTIKIIEEFIEWVKNVRDSNPFLAEPHISLKEQLNYFAGEYVSILEIIRSKIPVEFYNKMRLLIHSCLEQATMSNMDLITYLNLKTKEDNVLLFGKIMRLRLFSVWSSAAAIYSGFVGYHNKDLALLKSGLGIVEGVIQCIPLISGLPKIISSSADFMKHLHEVSPTLEIIEQSITPLSVCLEGVELFDSYFYGHDKLCRLFFNLDIYAKEYIDNISSTFCYRYEEQVKLFPVTDQVDVVQFAEDVASFILKFLTIIKLSDEELKNSLVLLAIIWCSRHAAGKGHRLKSMNFSGEEVTSGDLLSRTELICSEEIELSDMKETKEVAKKESKPTFLGLSPFLIDRDKTKSLPVVTFGTAKATDCEVAMIARKLKCKELTGDFLLSQNNIFASRKLRSLPRSDRAIDYSSVERKRLS